MPYQRTQVYLEPENHARLVKEAEAKGISLAQLVRELVSAHVSERSSAYGEKSLDAIIGMFDGPDRDVVRDEARERDEISEWLLKKKFSLLGEDEALTKPIPPVSKPRKKKPRKASKR